MAINWNRCSYALTLFCVLKHVVLVKTCAWLLEFDVAVQAIMFPLLDDHSCFPCLTTTPHQSWNPGLFEFGRSAWCHEKNKWFSNQRKARISALVANQRFRRAAIKWKSFACCVQALHEKATSLLALPPKCERHRRQWCVLKFSYLPHRGWMCRSRYTLVLRQVALQLRELWACRLSLARCC